MYASNVRRLEEFNTWFQRPALETLVAASDGSLSGNLVPDLVNQPLITRGKDYVKQLLATVGIPVPGAVVTTEMNIIVERQLVGSLHWLLVIDGSLAAAVRREPAMVIGDTRHNIRELMELANRDGRRGLDSRWPYQRLQLDDDAMAFLQESGRSPETIPGRDEKVPLCSKISTGSCSMAWDVTAKVHPQTREFAIQAACLVGLKVATIDVIATDIAQPLGSQEGGFLEVNELPGIFLQAPAAIDPPRPVGEA